MTLALVNGRILRDSGWTENQVVLIVGSHIADIVARDDYWTADQSCDLQGNMLLPGFIDVQVNGGGGVLFNDEPSVASIREIGRARPVSCPRSSATISKSSRAP